MLQHCSSRDQEPGLQLRIKEARSCEVRITLVLFIKLRSTIINNVSSTPLRNDSSIEIWDLANAPFFERVIPGKCESTVEVICWAGSRLFSVGLSGDGLKEWDLTTSTPKRSLLLTGEKGICMDYHPATETLVVGTEEGIVNVLDLSNDNLQYVRVLDRQDHRIICCKFNDAGDKLVSGSIDAVKVWNVRTGQVIHKMSTGRTDPNQETIVWCIDVLNNFTIVTGDSRGKVTFWDGNLGTQIDYVLASQADVMCLSVSEDRKSFFCSGIEQILKKYTLVVISKAGSEVEQWVKSNKRSKIHTHDVLSMVTIGNDTLISGGVDGFLSFGTQDFKHFERSGPFLKRPFAEIANEGRLILLKYVNYLEVWKLASGNELEEPEREMSDDGMFDEPDVFKPIVATQQTNSLYKIADFPEKFLELRSKRDEMIVCCAISNDGRWIVYSTMSSIRLFCFEIEENSKPKLKLMKRVPKELEACVNMTFSKNSKTLLTVKNNGHCSVFHLAADVIEHRDSIDTSEHHSDLIHLITISSCSKYLVLSSLCKNTTVWNLKKNKWAYVKTLPRYSCPATSLCIRKNQPALVVSYSDNKLLEFNLDGHFIQFAASLSENSSSVESAVTNICLDPRNPEAIILCRSQGIHVLLKNSEKASNKKAKVTTDADEGYSLKLVKKFDTVRTQDLREPDLF